MENIMDIDRSLLTTVENFGRTDWKKYVSKLTVRKVNTISEYPQLTLKRE
jgi:hypothetical protein